MNLSKLEAELVYNFRPTFLAYDFIPETKLIHVIISSNQFENLTVNERISKVYNVLENTCKNLLEEYTIVTECFLSKEIEDLFETF